ncbi:hypothetical protein J7K27_03805 [Candidatus Bathyarchaeota archaeon]|nr:hypothetical protein [Candidatus Bathyarchaeota archaeon]
MSNLERLTEIYLALIFFCIFIALTIYVGIASFGFEAYLGGIYTSQTVHDDCN